MFHCWLWLCFKSLLSSLNSSQVSHWVSIYKWRDYTVIIKLKNCHFMICLLVGVPWDFFFSVQKKKKVCRGLKKKKKGLKTLLWMHIAVWYHALPPWYSGTKRHSVAHRCVSALTVWPDLPPGSLWMHRWVNLFAWDMELNLLRLLRSARGPFRHCITLGVFILGPSFFFLFFFL